MAGAGKKTFTAGETLTASDVNTYLMEQSVMVFGGTAARSSAIPTPSEGMTSYRTDTQQIESYDGAEWRGMSGLQLVKKQTIGTAVSSVTVTNAFSSVYDAYKIVISGGSNSVVNDELQFKLGASATGYYGGFIGTVFSTGSVNNSAVNNASSFAAGVGTGSGLSMNVDVNGPFLSSWTFFQGSRLYTTIANFMGGVHQVASSYTDFTITTTGTMTGGTIYVYGYAK